MRRRTGDLERAVLRVLWSADGPVSGSWVREQLDGDPRPALTTVLTVLTRLVDKGSVSRSGTHRAVRFSAGTTEAEAAAGAMQKVLAETSDRPTALAEFAGRLDDVEVRALRRALDGEQ